MSRDTKSHQRIQAIDERLARLRAERIRLAARLSRTERKRDTRRKILIGAAVLAAIDHEGVPVLRREGVRSAHGPARHVPTDGEESSMDWLDRKARRYRSWRDIRSCQ